MRSIFIASLLLALLLVYGASAAIPPEDFLFLNDSVSGQPAAVVQADRITGNRTIVSQFGVRGAGPNFDYSIGGIDVAPNGNIYVSGPNGSSIFKIDPATGDRTVISSSVIGSGPLFSSEGDLVIGPLGDIFVARENSIIRVNPTTGDRFLVSGPGKGSGQQLQHVTGLTVTLSGSFFAFETSAITPDDDLVFFVDGATGNRTIISGGNIGSGPAFNHFGFDVELLPGGDLAVVDHADRILRVNTTTGARSILAGPGVGTGPALERLEWLTLDSTGFLIAAEPFNQIFRVNPANGDRSIITGGGIGIGPAMNNREAVEYTLVPEPS